MATCFVSSNGLKVTVEQAKCVQANAFIQSTLFQQFTFLPDAPAVFRINLTALIVSVEAAASFLVLSLAHSQALSQQTSFQAHSPFIEYIVSTAWKSKNSAIQSNCRVFELCALIGSHDWHCCNRKLIWKDAKPRLELSLGTGLSWWLLLHLRYSQK